ncbi:MAG: helix-turn-helix domain-containing protein [Proteobacteria bacterium]|nr:helix-turn-helix domain-containing protein [Pseudomonadota bacterium]HQR02907.1 helix-turn-helix domain-containing protein [Rhodocyclaceae bacterium]
MTTTFPGQDNMVWRGLDGWREFMSLRYPGVQVFSENSGRGFRTRYRSWWFSGLELAEIRSASGQSLQVPQPQQAAPDSYYLTLQLSGGFHGGQDDRECHAGPRSMLLLDSHVSQWRELGADSHLLNVRLPKSMLEHYLADPRAVCMSPVSAAAGQGALVWDFITALWARRVELDAAGMTEMAAVVAHLVAGLFGARHSGTPAGSRRVQSQRQRVLEYIAASLRDPQLEVRHVADACAISPRYVHLLMRDSGRTFSQYLLEHRLEGCRAALQGAAGMRRSITEIAFGWGFNDASHFSRAFRNRYGLSPREFRNQARALAR